MHRCNTSDRKAKATSADGAVSGDGDTRRVTLTSRLLGVDVAVAATEAAPPSL